MAVPATAQETPPPSATPDQLLDRPDTDRPQIQTDEDVLTLPGAPPEAVGGDAEKAFVLQRVVLEGSQVYTDADVAEIVAEYIGREVSFADLNAIARAVTLRYRADGFVLSQAVLPPQEVEGGVVRLQALEGRIGEVQVIGEVRELNGLIGRMANKIKSDRPLNVRELERYLLLIDDLPGITARGTVQPGSAPGVGVLLVTVEQDQIEGAIAADNLGSNFVGQYRGTVVGAVNSLWGRHERTTMRGIMTGFRNQSRELRFVDITHEEQVGTEGLRIRARTALTRTKPGEQFRSLGIDGESYSAEIQGLYPLLRSRRTNINLLGGFSALQSTSDFPGFPSLSTKDHVRTIWWGGNVDFSDPFGGVTQVELIGEHGLDVFNATTDGFGRTRVNGEHEYFLARGRLTRVQNLAVGFSARATIEGQVSDDPLLASQEVAFGGTEIGRAYDFAEIVGDDGIGGVAELRWAGPPVTRFVESYQVYGFYDFASVWNQESIVGERSQISIASLGGGVRFNLPYAISGFVEVGLPLTKDVAAEGDDDPRVFFSLRKRF